MKVSGSIIILLLFLTSCSYQQLPQTKEEQLNISCDNVCSVKDGLPDKCCTPGSHFPLTTIQVNGKYAMEPGQVIVGDICVSGYTKNVRRVTDKMKKQVLALYNVTDYSGDKYEIDHLIPLELGGDNDIKNLFPEPLEPRPGFREKDKVENCLHRLVCDGTIELSKAQELIANNWKQGLSVCGYGG